LTQFNKLFFSLLLVADLFAPAAFAGTGQEGQELLSRSFQQADLWNQGPVKLVAKVRMPTPNGQVLKLQYIVSWASPEKWRAEWSAPGLQQITILNNGKLSYVSNQPVPWVRTIEFEAALAALGGGTPSGPYPFAPLDYESGKLHVSKRKINGTDAGCLAFGKPETTLCIDPASGHLLTADSELGSFEYSDYTSVGSNSYPQTVKVSYVTIPMEDARVTVMRGEKFPDSLFAAPETSTTLEFSSCPDLATNFTAPYLEKSVKAKMPHAARNGVVWVLATVGKDGSVQKTTVLEGERDMRSAATYAVQRYKYTPYIRCGQAVEFQQMVGVSFAPPPPPVPIEQPPPPARHP
jgi:hypothetical protein